MVLVQSSPRIRSFDIHPNPARIAGGAIAIVVNVAALFAMTLLMRAPLPLTQIDRVPIRWVLPREKQDPPPPPPVVEVIEARQVTQTPVEPQTVVSPVEQVPSVSDHPGPLDMPYMPAVESMQPTVTEAPASVPATGMRLEYASAPPPAYPRDELLAGNEGTVLLQVLVGVDGVPLEVTVHTSSGNKRLDRAAQQHVLRKWRFQPATRDGRTVQAIGLVPIDFKLQ